MNHVAPGREPDLTGDRTGELERELREAAIGAGFCVTLRQQVNHRCAAALIGVSSGTLKNWRVVGHGPSFQRRRRTILYGLRSIAEFIVANECTFEGEREITDGHDRPRFGIAGAAPRAQAEASTPRRRTA
jgi:hypothetical protein